MDAALESPANVNTKFESPGRWHDEWAAILRSAPDSFRSYDFATREFVAAADQAAALNDAYDTLMSGFTFAERALKKDPHSLRIVRELIEMAFEAYRAGDGQLGNHTLIEAEGMIWKGRRVPIKYAVEAERRAFGVVERYKDVKVSPYPCEGRREDLGPAQIALLAVAETWCRERFAAQAEFKFFAWVQLANGTIEPFKAPSRKKLRLQLQESARAGEIVGAAVATLVISAVSGLVVFDLHEKDRPRVEAIALTKAWQYAEPRFHVHDPTIFGGPTV